MWRPVSFVGSTPIAKYVHRRATEAGKRVQALGGAKNHAVVMPDADLDFTAGQLTSAGLWVGGAAVHGDLRRRRGRAGGRPLLERLEAQARAVKVGPGLEEGSEMGPVITAQARERIVDYIGQGEQAGAQPVVDGRELKADAEGFFVGPTLLDGVTPEMSVYRDEIFGPVLSVVRVDSLQEAIDLINANAYANGTAIFTSSGQAARTFQRQVQVGMIGVNIPIPVPMAFYSFGGWKDSLFGDHHIHGPEGIRFYTRAKAITTRWPQDAQDPTHHQGHLHFPTAV
jgi:malonate-semialdehyde dehydrogenase (acetylating)/methylmalonate-semialdehyde dehydrogenase